MLKKNTNKITKILIYVILEWTLIFLLLLNSLFSYLILKFAVYFRLKKPCFLCSRLDHVLDSNNSNSGKKKSISSWNDFFCNDHAIELSKLRFCFQHNKLLETRNVCEGCAEQRLDEPFVKCGCCDGVIKARNVDSEEYIGFLASVIAERELKGCFLEDEDEDEKEPLLSVNGDDDGDDDEVKMFAKQRHLEFYVDHDDYRLIPVEITGEAVKNAGDSDEEGSKKGEKSGIFERFCRDVELVFEGGEVMSGFCKVNGTGLASIQEDEEEEEEELVAGELAQKQVEVDSHEGLEFVAAEKQVEVDSHEGLAFVAAELAQKQVEVDSHEGLEFVASELGQKQVEVDSHEGLEFVAAELAEKQVEVHSHEGLEFVKEKRGLEELVAAELDEKQVEVHPQGLEFAKEFDEEEEIEELGVAELAEEAEKQVEEHSKVLILEFTEEKREIEELVAAKVVEKQVEERSQVSEFVEEKREIEDLVVEAKKQVEVHSEVLEISQEIVEEKREIEELVAAALAEKQVKVHSEELVAAEVATEAVKQVEEHSPVLESDEEKREIVDLVAAELAEKQAEVHSQVSEFTHEIDEEKTGIENSLVLHKQDKSTVSENASVLQEMIEDTREIEAENGLHSTSAVNEEEIETGIDKNENVSQEVLIEVTDHRITCENNSPSTDENDADVNKRSLNINVVRVSINETEDDKIPDTPNSVSSPNVHKKLMLLGRSRSITEESLDGSVISEHEGVDGATLVSKLKMELQTEKKTLRAVYAELEEERNASAIAANQTMAMINRLQEEKAMMQMEALQYQRMMEEQSEYDQEALQMMNELMVKREKEKQELEKEVEVYRKKLLDFEEREKVRILSRRMEGSASVRSRNSSASCSYGEESDGLSIDLNHEVKEHEEETGVLSPSQDNTPSDAFLGLQESLGGFENERMSILEQLKVLEEKLFSLADEEEENESSKEIDDENGWPNGSMQKRLLPLFDEVELLDSHEEYDVNKPHTNKFELEKKRVAIEEEVDHVYERLHALEADREFLKHCIGSLKKGDKGLDLLQEILQHLRDLKNVELHVMKNNMDPCSSI